MKANTADKSQPYSMIFLHGPTGVGKTSLAATCLDHEETKDTLFISLEDGEMVLADRGESLPILGPETWDEYVTIMKHLSNGTIQEYVKSLIGIEYQFKSIIIDGFQELVAYIFADVHNMKGGKVSNKAEYLLKDNLVVKDPNWTALAKGVSNAIRTLRALPYHVVVTCAEKQRENKAKETCYLPAVPGQLTTLIPHAFDTAAFIVIIEETNKETGEITTDQYCYLQPVQDRYISKCRVNRLKGVKKLVNPTIKDFLGETHG